MQNHTQITQNISMIWGLFKRNSASGESIIQLAQRSLSDRQIRIGLEIRRVDRDRLPKSLLSLLQVISGLQSITQAGERWYKTWPQTNGFTMSRNGSIPLLLSMQSIAEVEMGFRQAGVSSDRCTSGSLRFSRITQRQLNHRLIGMSRR